MYCTCCLQDSDVVYCGRLSLVADLLQGLFKEAYSLQKGLLELLDRISLDSSASEEEISDFVTGVCLQCVCYVSPRFQLTHSFVISGLVSSGLYRQILQENVEVFFCELMLNRNIAALLKNGWSRRKLMFWNGRAIALTIILQKYCQRISSRRSRWFSTNFTSLAPTY